MGPSGLFTATECLRCCKMFIKSNKAKNIGLLLRLFISHFNLIVQRLVINYFVRSTQMKNWFLSHVYPGVLLLLNRHDINDIAIIR